MQIKSKQLGRAKGRVIRWFDATEQPPELREAYLKGVELIADELLSRGDWFEVSTVALGKCEGAPMEIAGRSCRAFSGPNVFAVSTVAPGWRFGWRTALGNGEVYETLSWFLHYAAQYVHRSYIANVLMTVWEKREKVLHPFGSSMIQQRYGPVIKMESVAEALGIAKEAAIEAWNIRRPHTIGKLVTSPWMNRNLLDPLLHQAVFHFLRAQNLFQKGFIMEGVVATDCVAQSIAGFIQARWHQPTLPTRRQVCEHLDQTEDAELAEYVYFLRNNFGAHAGGWRWWDQDELLDDLVVNQMGVFAKAILEKAADFEPEVRVIAPYPSDWRAWLFENFEMIWDAVWFDRLDLSPKG